MNEELLLAIEQLRLRPRDRQWFMPVVLDRCTIPDYPIGAGETLQDLHHLDFSADWDAAISQLVRAISPDAAAGAADVPPANAQPAATSPRSAAPRQLPPATGSFTGRTRELAELTTALTDAQRDRRTVVISSIGGMGGIGKTSLALHWSHQNIGEFPDGQLFVDLRGFDPSDEPMPVAEAIRCFLDALGVTPESLPADVDAQIGLYRSLVAGKNMLILLDNARDVTHVARLLPGPGADHQPRPVDRTDRQS
jgi:hypothetical protein